jgi:transcription initiation factor TFIID subunit 7
MSGADGATPAAPPKPRLKLNIRSSSFVGAAGDASATPATATPGPKPTSITASAATPSDGQPRKLKLKVSSSQVGTPVGETPTAAAAIAVAPPPSKTKAGRQPKPTQKLVDSKKRAHDDDDDEDDNHKRAHHHAHPSTKIKIRPAGPKSAPTQLVVKPRGRPPVHPPGDGYDSEASDRELDPAIEEQLILRMLPGEHCDYVRTCMETGKMGMPRNQGGADVQIRFFDEESRRAVVTVKGQPFAAVMVDLPTITEAMKTWDRKSFMKSADICQMLLVFQKVKNDDEAKKAPLPEMIGSHFKWPHGLTPPMHDAVNRRFAKTIIRKEIEDKEAEVERLLAEDAKAETTRWEWMEDRQQEEEEYEEMDEDAEGEVDETGAYYAAGDEEIFGAGTQEDDDALEADLEAAFADDLFAETPATAGEGATPMTATQVDTPAAVLQQSIEEDESAEDEDDDDDDDDDDELDDDEREERNEREGVKDMIAGMKKQLASKQAELQNITNMILKRRLESQIKELNSAIELKLSAIGMEAEEDD